MNRNPESQVPTVELVARVHAGDVVAREALFARYQERILSIVRARLSARLRRRIDSQDVLQDVLMEALRELEHFEMRDESSLIRWLAVLVEHRIGAHARYQTAEKRDGGELPIASADDEQLGLAGEAPSASEQLSARESRARLQEALTHLPERQRELILLRDYAGTPWEEIARELSLESPDAARMMHARTLVRLGSILRSLPH